MRHVYVEFKLLGNAIRHCHRFLIFFYLYGFVCSGLSGYKSKTKTSFCRDLLYRIYRKHHLIIAVSCFHCNDFV